ncbi:cytochrome P450 2D18 [Cucurbitaria berberidis CBS 394.84]|uniref:Cytochrome P450 2D18 n=1 Tax=Cucurbitaria berberidis CBS 394.84 TaxID=1168544 RepID=A0A9P4GEN7_9PLEO|nr:cytochrome P450 2D18 [Cucurbitaria berberidis CBS 394.84]KAF1843820.1 cytochrome P450 2D18 [Cucurbitaria berberidis CBS 394.84]
MRPLITTFCGLIAILCVLFLVHKLLRFGHRDKRLPPGPPTIPILGNAHLIPSHGLHLKFKEWSDKYGNIFSLKIGAGTVIVLSDRRAVHDLIGKRSAIYSERPLDNNSEVAFGGENFAFLHATPSWRAQRKVASQYLAPKSIDDKIAPIQEAETCQLVHDLLETPDQFFAHIKRVTASIAAIAIFGFRAPTVDSHWTTINPTCEPGSYLPIEQFPILKYIPDRWAPSKARAKHCYRAVTAIWVDARKRVEKRRQNGDERSSMADRVLSGEVKFDVPLTPTQLSNFFGTLHQGGADTTSSMVLTHVLYLAKHPLVQHKARLELDCVCGTERMPTWADFKDLPYINCIIKEGLRLRPVSPVGVPHRVSRDDWFDGLLIPKDATIFFPPHALNSPFEDPETYNPDRFLGRPKLAMDYAGSPDYMNRDHYAYGGGRRICVGIHLAERMQWRIVGKLLWAFEIKPAVDEETGKSVNLDLDAYVDGFLMQPAPYKVRFTPRSEKHARIIQQDFKNIEDFLKKWE